MVHSGLAHHDISRQTAASVLSCVSSASQPGLIFCAYRHRRGGTGTDVLGDQKSVPDNLEIRASYFDDVLSVL